MQSKSETGRFPGRDELKAVESFVASCPGIVNLTLLMSGAGPRLLPVLREMPIQRLGANQGNLLHDQDKEDRNEGNSPVDFGQPVFAAVTHLDVFDDLDGAYDEAMGWLNGVGTVPVLTHLALAPVHPDTLQHILSAAPRFRVNTAESFAQLVTFTDARLVVAVSADEFAYGWEQGARGEEDIWVRVESFLERKRSGEIDALQYFFVNYDVDASSDTDTDTDE
ncbi:hypothetical protein FB451DRAFT_1420779 [Mycena latifolia]|nr:hypothetical protein FB451DRAFT_1420779 [Mycena latifolia]